MNALLFIAISMVLAVQVAYKPYKPRKQLPCTSHEIIRLVKIHANVYYLNNSNQSWCDDRKLNI